MIKRLLFLFVACFLSFSVKAQVNLISVDQLEDRFRNGKDTVYIVNFWATWCGPCIEELPHFERLQQTYEKSPLKVLMVSTDFRSKLETAVKPFVKRHRLTNEVFLLNEKSQQIYIDRISKEWSGALPATLVVNQKKKVRKLYEREFTYPELEKVYQTHK